MNVSRFAIRHPAIIIIVMIALIVFGIIALFSLNQEFLPNVALPEIIVFTSYPGVGPADVEREVTDVLEEQLSTMPGLQQSRSVSRDSVSMIHLSFVEGTDLYATLPEVRAKIDQIAGNLPDGIHGNPMALVAGVELMPIFSFAVISDQELTVAADFVNEHIIPQLSQIPGVSRAGFYGARSEQVFVDLQIKDLEAVGISVLQIYEALNYANIALPAGSTSYRGSELSVRITGEFRDLQEIRNLVVGQRGNSLIYLRDVAEVYLGYPDPEVYIDSDGASLLIVDVMKRQDGNTMDIISTALDVLESVEATYPAVSFEILQDDSSMVRSSLMTVVRSGLIGMAMAVLVILIFLGDIKATLIIASSLPMSIVFAFIGMRAAGQSVNILSLSGLVVALGMVVDSSIVILENIYRHYNTGKDAVHASEEGTREVSGAVIASASTTISVFLPLIALTGIIGIIMKDISLTLVFALLGSLTVSLVVIPFFTSQYLSHKRKRKKKPLISLLMEPMQRSYGRTLSWCIRSRGFVFFTAVAVLAASVLIIGFVGLTFIPSADTGEFYVFMRFPESYTLEQSRQQVLLAELIIREQVPEIDKAYFFTGYASEYGRTSTVHNAAYGKILLESMRERERGVHEIITAVQFALEERLLDADIVVENGGFDQLMALATEGMGFQIRLTAQNFELLQQTAGIVEQILAADPQVYKTTTTMDFDREMAIGDLALHHLGTLGFSTFEAAMTSRILLTGEQVGTFRGTQGEMPIYLRSNLRSQPLTTDVMEQIQLVDSQGRAVSFSTFMDLRIEPAFSRIEHRDRVRTISVTGYLTDQDVSGITRRIEQQLNELDLPFGVSWSIGGTTELLMSSLNKLLLVLAIAVFLVYAVMVIQFERFTQPLIVMVSIPFCIVGVVLGLMLFGSNFSIVAFLGIIALGGIVVNNAIVLIDYINLLRKERDMGIYQAVIHGSVRRLRPILMTTLTTFFGVLPLAFSRGDGAEIYAVLGQSIAGGLLTSTVITLILVPLLYYQVETRKEARLLQQASGG